MTGWFNQYFLFETPAGPLLERTYNPQLVTLSYLVAVFASYTTLHLVVQMRTAYADGDRFARFWWLGAASTLGGGIFVMHFIAMLAFSLPLRVSYDFGMTLLSVVVAIAVSAVALAQIRSDKIILKKLLSASVLMGLGVASMHYVGMAGVLASATLRFELGLWLLSVGIAIVVSFVAMLLLRFIPEIPHHFQQWLYVLTAMVMGVAVAAMHYTGMAAANFYAGGMCGISTGLIDIHLNSTQLGFTVSVVAMLIIGIAMIASVFNEKMNSVLAKKNRELREAATFTQNIIQSMTDALFVITPDETISSSNQTARKLLGYSENELLGMKVGRLLEEEEEEEEEALTIDKRLLCKDGSRIPVSVSRSPLTSGEQAEHGEVWVCHDLRDRIKIEEKEKEKVEQEHAEKTAYQAGMSEMNASIFHNIGNTVGHLDHLSSVLKNDRKTIGKLKQIFTGNISEIQTEIESLSPEATIPVLKKLPEILEKGGQAWSETDEQFGEHISKLWKGVNHIIEIIRIQQQMSHGVQASDYKHPAFALHEMVRDAVEMEQTLQKR